MKQSEKMINIIPKPYRLINNQKSFKVNGFSFECPDKLSLGLELFKSEFMMGDFLVKVHFKRFNNPEAYSLKVDKAKIIIEAGNASALFYATRTLKQLIHAKKDCLFIQCCEIFDKPQMLYRSFSLDEVRHFYGKEEVMKILDVLALLKINYFHWHLSDDQGFRVNFKKYPHLKTIGSKRARTQIINDFGNCYDETPYEYCYEEEDVREIIEYAKKRFINITPEFDVPGHTASLVASYPFLHCFDKQIKVFERAAGNYDIICPGKDSTYEFLDGLFAEIMKLFADSEYIHLGGDEVIPTNWQSCPHCRQKMQELKTENPHDLQGYFSNRLINMLTKYNKKLIMWHDGIKDDTNPNVILQYWVWQMDKVGIERINNGRKTIYSPCSQMYFDSAYAELPLQRTYSRGIKLDGLSKKGRANIFGMECCSWNEFIRDKDFLEFMIFPRIHAFSESCWTFNKYLDYQDFRLRLKYHYQLLEAIGINYCKDHLLDNDYNEDYVSPLFRRYNRYIEYHQN